MSGSGTAQGRPKSPNIQIYRPQLTSVLSIANRITGLILAVAAVGLVAWLLAAAEGPHAYDAAQRVLASPLGRIGLFGITFAFFLHLCGGIRHLAWVRVRPEGEPSQPPEVRRQRRLDGLLETPPARLSPTCSRPTGSPPVSPSSRTLRGIQSEPRHFGSRALIAGANSIIGCAASHMRSKCASNFATPPGSRMTIRSLSCVFSPLVLKFAEPRAIALGCASDYRLSRATPSQCASASKRACSFSLTPMKVSSTSTMRMSLRNSGSAKPARMRWHM